MVEYALSGLRVLDVSHYISGPYCTKLLAGLGAEVIKIERPGDGDGARRLGPFPNDEPHPEKSGLFLYLNTNKKGIGLNLKTEMGRSIFKELVKSSDIVIENFEPRVMPSLGLSYDELSQVNPRLIMASISNFGQTGPYRDYRAEEIVVYAMGGLMHITGEPDQEPVKSGAELSQFGTGQDAFVATLTALYHRDRSGEGQYIDISIVEHNTTILENMLMMYTYKGDVMPRAGNRGWGRAAWGIYPCQDGYVGVIAGPAHRWPAMAELMDEPELLDPRFATEHGRVLYADLVDAYMLPWLVQHDKLEIFQKAQDMGLAFAYVTTAEDLLNSPQLQDRQYFVEIDHPYAGKLAYPGAPYKMSEASWRFDRAPLLGEHNQEIYCGSLGFSLEELRMLKERGVI